MAQSSSDDFVDREEIAIFDRRQRNHVANLGIAKDSSREKLKKYRMKLSFCSLRDLKVKYGSWGQRPPFIAKITFVQNGRDERICVSQLVSARSRFGAIRHVAVFLLSDRLILGGRQGGRHGSIFYVFA